MPESKRHSHIKYDSKGFTPIDGKLPYWNPGNPNLHWGFEEVGGIDGKRYLHYPEANFYVNEDGTVRAFGQESIPIVNRRGKNYIEVMVPGADSTKTWWTGSDYYTVKNHYRFPVGDTIRYVAPPVLQPKPEQTEEKQQITEKDAKPVITKPKPASKPKPTLVKKPIPIPDDMKKGLVKVEGGIPHYELEGDPEEIARLIEEYLKSNKADDNVYLNTETKPKKVGIDNTNTTANPANTASNTLTEDTPVNNDEDVYFRHESYRKVPTVLVKQGDEGAYLYKYPHRDVNIYKVSPELAKYILDKLSNNTRPSEPTRLNFVYSTVPLKNLPNGELNDTTFHDIFTLPKNSTWIDYFDGNIAHDNVLLKFYNAIGQGYHTDDGLPVTLIESLMINSELPIEGNKVFIPLSYFMTGDPYKYFSYHIPYPDHTTSKEYLRKLYKNAGIETFATDIHGKEHFIHYPASEYDFARDLLRNIVPIQSHQAVKDSLEQARLQVQNSDSATKGSWWTRLIGKNKKGGILNKIQLYQRNDLKLSSRSKLNYLNYFN